MMSAVCLNGKIVPAETPVFLPGNKSYRYGDGLFETMKMVNGKISLAPLHFERLFSSLQALGYNLPSLFTVDRLQADINQLCKKNGCASLARIRLSIFRGEGGLYEGNDDPQ